MSLRQTIKKIPGAEPAFRFFQNRRFDRLSVRNMQNERRIPRQGAVKVGFLCQYIPAWAKVETIYRMMLADPRFEPVLICLPSGIRDNRLTDPEIPGNDTHDYFLSHGYPEALDARQGKESWLDLEALGLEYLFYPRPYNSFLPRAYTTSQVSRYCRICLLMYGMEITEEITRTTLNRDFMAYVSYYFAGNTAVQQVHKSQNRKGHALGLQKTPCLGMPVLESLHSKREEESASWAFSRNDFRVMWTPRWTTALEEGGSNFFTYYRSLTAYAKAHPDMDFLYRPHPLAFAHFMETGEMTPEEVEDFKAEIEAAENISLDTEPQYDATLWRSSVLISDYSGMVPEYFSTGKPLIFCMSNMILTLSDFGRRMMEGCYRVNNEAELFACLEMLKAGQDPLKEKRQEIIAELYGNNAGACARILDELAR